MEHSLSYISTLYQSEILKTATSHESSASTDSFVVSNDDNDVYVLLADPKIYLTRLL